jgi:putative spermidine/putrescine transport system substrate-binding protein
MEVDDNIGLTTRREFARRAGILGLSLASLPAWLSACGGGEEAGGKTVTMVSFGGTYNDNLNVAVLRPFTSETGINVKLGANTSLAGVKSQVRSGNILWDIAELTGAEYELAVKDDLLEPLDFDVIKTANVPAFAKKDFGIKYALFLFVMAWDERQIKTPPETWEQFLDPGRYPQKRSLYEVIGDGSLLEAGLIADGVPMDRLYPLDVDRALKSLERLPADMVIFHSTNQEPVQQLIAGEVGLSTAFNGRITIARNEGAKLNFTPNQGGVSGDYLVVPKGARNKEGAFRLINFIVNDADSAANFSKLTNYALANKASLKKLPKGVASKLPTSPTLEGKVFEKDDAWWAANLEKTEQVFKEWQAERT